MPVVSAPADRQRRVTLRPVPESAKVAREFTVATLRAWHAEALISDAVLIASELATNAISHGSQHAEDEPGAWAEPGTPIELTWSYQAGRLICVITDRAVDPPVMSLADTDAESGYGLQIVGALAVAWGWTMLGTGEKAVWAALDLP